MGRHIFNYDPYSLTVIINKEIKPIIVKCAEGTKFSSCAIALKCKIKGKPGIIFARQNRRG